MPLDVVVRPFRVARGNPSPRLEQAYCGRMEQSFCGYLARRRQIAISGAR
jgi:hypothetical protein